MPAPRVPDPGVAPSPDEPATPAAGAGRGSRDRLRISGISVVAGAAAAATASAATSVLGVAGTVVGAAVVSAVITVAAAVYDHSLRAAKIRLADRIEVTARLPRLRADGSVDTDHEATGESAADRAVRASFSSPLEATAEGVEGPSTGELAAALGAETPAELLAQTGERPDLALDPLDLEDERGYHWGRIALVSLVVFLLAMAVVTGFELVTGRPLSSLFTDTPAQGTTVGRIVRPHHANSSTPAPTPTTPAPTPTTPTPTPTSPSPSPTPTSPPPSPTPTSTSPAPTRTPTTSTTLPGNASPTARASGSASPSPSGRLG